MINNDSGEDFVFPKKEQTDMSLQGFFSTAWGDYIKKVSLGYLIELLEFYVYDEVEIGTLVGGMREVMKEIDFTQAANKYEISPY